MKSTMIAQSVVSGTQQTPEEVIRAYKALSAAERKKVRDGIGLVLRPNRAVKIVGRRSSRTVKATLLTPPNKSWHLNALLGDAQVEQALSENGGKLTDSIIINLLVNSQLPFFTDPAQHYLTMGTSELLERDFGPLTRISSLEALTRFGLAKMEEANERGYARL